MSSSMRKRRTLSKYNAQPTEVDGIRFASKKEAMRYVFLKGLLTAGKISALEIQPAYDIVVNGKKICRYIADFKYISSDGNEIIEDVKGFVTPQFRLKQKLMAAVHNIEINIVK